MRRSALFVSALAAGCISIAAPLAYAQNNLTPQQIQGQISAGQESMALGELHTILESNPHSGAAWYLAAEAQDASGNENAARTSLANAQQYAPGLPFAQPAKVAELQAHLNGGDANNGVTNGIVSAPIHRGMSPLVTGLIILGVLFFAVRMFFRSRRRYPAAAYPPNASGVPPYGPGGMPYGPGGGMGMGGMGGGIGSGLIGGLAAGAGFAAGERVIDDMMGGGRPAGFDQSNDQPTVPDRDDGLNNNADWGNNQDDNNIDPGTSW